MLSDNEIFSIVIKCNKCGTIQGYNGEHYPMFEQDIHRSNFVKCDFCGAKDFVS